MTPRPWIITNLETPPPVFQKGDFFKPRVAYSGIWAHMVIPSSAHVSATPFMKMSVAHSETSASTMSIL